jgi:uroporphyrinogen decarboxylase
MFRNKARIPNFNNLQLVLEKKRTPRPVLFDFIIGQEKEKILTGEDYCTNTEEDRIVTTIKAFDSAGYDFAPIVVRGMEFSNNESMKHGAATKSINDSQGITDKSSFDKYIWPEVGNCNFSIIRRVYPSASEGMKLVPFSIDGILENSTSILGFENMCYLLFDDLGLVEDVFSEVGRRIVSYYDKVTQYDEVGAIIINDDWGFNSQTMIAPELLRQLVFPWYKKVVSIAHSRGKGAILHSCGKYDDIIDDIVDMGFDGRHSYEDKIVPVEKAYEELSDKLAVLGGIDVNFLAQASSDEVYERCRNIVNNSRDKGGYALGSGNSVPDYISNENYFSMLRAANEDY